MTIGVQDPSRAQEDVQRLKVVDCYMAEDLGAECFDFGSPFLVALAGKGDPHSLTVKINCIIRSRMPVVK
jgi:hypothetical protein